MWDTENEMVILWWRHQMETFTALLAICAGNSPVTGEFLAQRPSTRSFDVFFDMRLNKRLSKQSGCWWFETPSRSLWRQCNAQRRLHHYDDGCQWIGKSPIIGIPYHTSVRPNSQADIVTESHHERPLEITLLKQARDNSDRVYFILLRTCNKMHTRHKLSYFID